MAKMRYIHVVAAYFFLVNFCSSNNVQSQHVDVPDSFVQDLMRTISERQVKEDVPLMPGVQWARRKGDYDSVIKLNIHGEGWKANLRRSLQIYDDNNFISQFISSVMLEAFQSGGPAPTEEQLLSTINFIGESVGKNSPQESSLLTFWPMAYKEEIEGYEQSPMNWKYIFQISQQVPLAPTAALLHQIGLGEMLQPFGYMIEDMAKEAYCYYKIPADIDDTFVWVSFGALLYRVKDTYPTAWEAWKKWNPNVTSVFDAVKRYAYRPFSGDSQKDTVDPRSYYGIRHFLDAAKAAGKDVVLPTVFFIGTGEQFTNKLGLTTLYLTGEADPVVGANFMYGTTLSILTGMVSPDVLEKDSDLTQIYLNTSSLIAHAINDLSDGSYVHTVLFYWCISRTVAALDTFRATKELPVPAMETVYQELKCALEGHATEYILNQAQSDEDGIYLDDFLGTADLTHDNKPLNHAEDRIFITSNAANVLMSTWLTPDSSTDSTTTMKWRPGTPENVKHTVDGCIKWLLKHTLEGQYKPWNTFFVGATRGPVMEPILYPANRYEYPDGTPIEDLTTLKPTDVYLLGVKGYISKEDYEVMMKQNDFGYAAPTSFTGYNYENAAFPFWSSESFTYVNVLLAASKYKTIRG